MGLIRSRREFLAGAAGVAGVVRAQESRSVKVLSDAQKEAYLSNAKVESTKEASRGITGTLRATLSDGKLTHDASIQALDEFKPTYQTPRGAEFNFKDTWKFNVAGYKLDRLLGLRMVPVSVERRFQGRDASFTWWVDDVLMMELDRFTKKIEPPDSGPWNEQMSIVRVFDQLIFNTDRNLGNLLIDKKWRLWMIDHSRAFRVSKDLLDQKNLVRCDRGLLEQMRKLTASQIKDAAGRWLESGEINGLLARRDKIVKLFEKKGPAFLYDSPRRVD